MPLSLSIKAIMCSPGINTCHWQRCFWELSILSSDCFKSSHQNHPPPWLVVFNSRPQTEKAIAALPWLSSCYFIFFPWKSILLPGDIFTQWRGAEKWSENLELVKDWCSRSHSWANNNQTHVQILNLSSGCFHSSDLLRHFKNTWGIPMGVTEDFTHDSVPFAIPRLKSHFFNVFVNQRPSLFYFLVML